MSLAFSLWKASFSSLPSLGRINSTEGSNSDSSIFWLFCFSLFSANLLNFLYYSLRITKFLRCSLCTSMLFRVLVSLANFGSNFSPPSQKSPKSLLSHWFLLDFLLGYSSFHPVPLKGHNLQAVRLILKSLPPFKMLDPEVRSPLPLLPYQFCLLRHLLFHHADKETLCR